MLRRVLILSTLVVGIFSANNDGVNPDQVGLNFVHGRVVPYITNVLAHMPTRSEEHRELLHRVNSTLPVFQNFRNAEKAVKALQEKFPEFKFGHVGKKIYMSEISPKGVFDQFEEVFEVSPADPNAKILDFPEDIVHLLFSYVGKDYAKLQLVCKEFHHFINPRSIAKLELEDNRGFNGLFENTFPRSGMHILRRLVNGGDWVGKGRDFKKKAMKVAIKCLPDVPEFMSSKVFWTVMSEEERIFFIRRLVEALPSRVGHFYYMAEGIHDKKGSEQVSEAEPDKFLDLIAKTLFHPQQTHLLKVFLTSADNNSRILREILQENLLSMFFRKTGWAQNLSSRFRRDMLPLLDSTFMIHGRQPWCFIFEMARRTLPYSADISPEERLDMLMSVKPGSFAESKLIMYARTQDNALLHELTQAWRYRDGAMQT